MTYAITGASGGFGHLAAVLTTRDPAKVADLAARGADVRHADFGEPDTLAAAFAGVDRLLLVSTDAVGTRLPQQRDAIAAAQAAGVRHVIYTSIPEPTPDNPAGVVADHAGTEEALRSSGLTWTSLRNNLYAHMQVPGLQHAIGTGQLVTNGGGGGTAYVTREDCAAAAVAVLTQDGHENVAYDVTGPDAITAQDLADLGRSLSGRDIEVIQVDDAAFAAGLEASGLPPFVAQLMASFGASTRGGYLSTVSKAVADLTGHDPTPLAEVLRAAI
jgi:NAD(P)H dehydrogenase (quinone)